MKKRKAGRKIAKKRDPLVVRIPNIIGRIASDQALIAENARRLAEAFRRRHAQTLESEGAPQ